MPYSSRVPGNGGERPGDSRLYGGYDPAITGELPEERTDRLETGSGVIRTGRVCPLQL